MTVSSTTTKNSYAGDGSNAVFAYTFKVFDEDDLTVILRTDATGTETVQTITTNYTVSGVGDAGGGNVTFVTAPASGVTVVIRRSAAITQTTDYTPNDPFPAEEHENALDKLTFIAQQQQEELDRAIKLSRTNTMTSTEFTVGSTDRANKILGFDGTGELSVTQELGVFRGDWTADTAFAVRDLIKDTTNDNIYICQTAHTSSGSLPISTNTDSSKWELIVDAATATSSATAAAASATAAAASATAASASETAAAASESAAATSESNASASETAAAASESAAATSESNAATSETNAATSATSAASSATSAASSATTATTKAAEASTSASNAATSETNAATSETNAASSASAASTSATNAASSATAAASSASSASSAQTAAEAARDSIQQFYLGAQASNPTVDGNGDPVTAGDWYFNTGNNTTRIYDGSAWNTVSPDLVGDATPQLGGNLDTNGNDINFGDNDKAVFGAGSDLQIYHNGSDSYIIDDGTGNLNLRASSQIKIQSLLGEDCAIFNENGSSSLQYDNATKLATTSSGIDVTGTVTADGLTVDTTGIVYSGGNVGIGTATTTAGQVTIQGSGLPRQLVITDDGVEKLQIFQIGNDATIEAASGGSNSTNLIFKTASSGAESEAARIDSSGNLLVAKSASDRTVAGGEILSNGGGRFTRDGADPLYLNRLTNDGTLISLRRNDSAVGSIGVDGGDNLYLTGQTGNTGGIYMNDAAVSPAYQGSERDAYYDLGKGAARWKDLHLSGQANVGTAVAATQSASVTGATTLDFSTYQNFILTMTGNITLAQPSTEQAGQSGFIIFIHSGAARTVSLGADYETAGAAGLTLSGASGAVDLVPYVVQSSGNILLGAPQLAFA